MTKHMKVLIIIPTYNERNNIEQLISKIDDLRLPNLGVLIIDDNSPDGTAEIVKDLQRKYKYVEILKRKRKLGLGTAYIKGFKWAIDRGYDVAVEMDGDLSHDPKYLPDMLAKLETHDFVIGSRYVEGGGVEDWPFKRRLISKLGSCYARVILGVKIMDFTGGFNIWKTSLLKKLDLDTIKSNGYSFQIELKYRLAKNDFSFVEVPIIFQDRKKGASKMSKKIFWEAIWRVWWLRIKKTKKHENMKTINQENTRI